MSLEVIKVIREAEEKAELIKKDAVQEAKQIISNANAEASRIVEEAANNADSNTKSAMQKAETEGQLLYDNIIEEAVKESNVVLETADKNMDKAAAIILERIVKTSGNS